MRLHAEAGNIGAALLQYEVCRDMLNCELAVRPSAETEALHRRIRESSPADEAVRPRAEEMLAPEDGDQPALSLSGIRNPPEQGSKSLPLGRTLHLHRKD
jgi:DNA-binding SARP family transcriptional activator